MASYRERLTADLDRWIAAGLVPVESRQAMLGSIVEPKRPDAATALAMVGAVFVGAAVIALVAANWDVLPRMGRFGILIAAFLAAAAGGAWAGATGRPNASNGLLAVAAAVFAAAIGLTGQIFDITGDPKTAALSAGIAAALLAAVGRSSGAAIVGLILICVGDFAPDHGFWLLPASLAGVAAAWFWRSVPTGHAAGVALVIGVFSAITVLWPGEHSSPTLLGLVASAILAAAAFAARAVRTEDRPVAGVLYGWTAWGALFAFAMAGVDMSNDILQVAHRVAWLLLGGTVIALGRGDRHTLVTAAGVVTLMGGVAAVLFDLGLDLISAAIVFGMAALVVLAAGWALRARSRA